MRRRDRHVSIWKTKESGFPTVFLQFADVSASLSASQS
jgi:hypothetical protein